MTPDDPRHGLASGAVRHWKDGEKPCAPCALAGSRARKARGLDAERGNHRRVPLGRAHQIITDMSRAQLSQATGIRSDKLSTYVRTGPHTIVTRTTRDKILRAAGAYSWTPTGVQRRLQGLARIGWSMRVVAELSGVHVDSLKKLRRHKSPTFVRLPVAEAILTVYEDLSFAAPPVGSSATETRNEAIRRGYAAPLAWDDIDADPAPRGLRSRHTAYDGRTLVDPATVLRLLAGERIPANAAERNEAMRRWRAAGRSERALCERLGWNEGRYGREVESA